MATTIAQSVYTPSGFRDNKKARQHQAGRPITGAEAYGYPRFLLVRWLVFSYSLPRVYHMQNKGPAPHLPDNG